ncbi:MAG: cytochrome c maturation protein CcmE [Polyangiaceae bacterium]|nr:cytochrome c maturation protein CcmE [Polyangiaceae bacterium]MCW5789661.1 cytochrome c maturation protein CcmE [Polyangiaceae bacterium]
MAKLDDELEAALADAEARAPKSSDAEPVARDVQAPKQGQRSLGLLVALLVIGGGLLVLVFTGFSDDAVYSRGVDELLSEKDAIERRVAQGGDPDAERERERLLKRNTRVTGHLQKGSLRHREQPCEYRFNVEKGGQALAVRYAQCVVPDTFRDVPDMDVEVTVTGKLTEEGHFAADHIMAKCPSKYEMQERAAKGEAAPHGDLGSQRVN